MHTSQDHAHCLLHKRWDRLPIPYSHDLLLHSNTSYHLLRKDTYPSVSRFDTRTRDQVLKFVILLPVELNFAYAERLAQTV